MKVIPLIYNPTAGALRRDPGKIDRLTRALARQGIDVLLLPTNRAGDATQLTRQSVNDGAEVVVVCGGDGTINEAAQSLVGTETALAVWPCGTANVLAREMRLPCDENALSELIADRSARTISVGRAVKPETGWQRYFLLMAGIGLDATIVNGVDLGLKRLIGAGAYLASGLDYLARLPLTPFSIDLNGRRLESTFTVISNAASYAVCFTLAPGAEVDDDKLDVCVFNSRSRLAYLTYAFLSMAKGLHTRVSKVVYQPAREAHANSNDNALVQLDGDVMGTLPMRFEIAPQALRIIAPAKQCH
ncbi:MAG TPA: diacylglycerol kinase family protein [Blastocatellia bacterium]|jgi:YegS/Rv2252/BmrU family lipid kinase|nr:diacylglycerol kinase family protein [Blastocatellia bacterium]